MTVSYLDHIHACNNFDPSGFRPLYIGAARVGFVRPALALTLTRWPAVFRVGEDAVHVHERLDSFESRSAALDGALRQLAEQGEIPPWGEELYPVAADWQAPPLMQIERAACPPLGIRACGVHLNGFVRKADGIHMWVARRARDKPSFPGRLDNIVAGGQPIGLSLIDNLLKECREEAGIPADLARRCVPVGMVSYTHEAPQGCKPERMFCYDLQLPEDFEPVAVDGEVEAFYLWPIRQVADIVRDSGEFKFNCNLVIIDFLLRHGVLDPDTEADYAALVHGLRAGGAV